MIAALGKTARLLGGCAVVCQHEECLCTSHLGLDLTSSLFTLAAHMCASSPSSPGLYLVLPLAAFYGSGPSLAAGIGMGIAPPRRRLPAPGGIATGAAAGAASASSVDNAPRSSVVQSSTGVFNQRWWHEMQVLLAPAGFGTPSSAAFSRCRRASAGDIGAASTSFAFGVGSRSTQHLRPKHHHFQNPFAQICTAQALSAV